MISRTVLLLPLLLCLCAVTARAQAPSYQAPSSEGSMESVNQLEPAERLFWRTHWPRYAAAFIEYEGRFLGCPYLRPDLGNSRRLTRRQATAELTETYRVAFAQNMSQRKRIAPDPAEVDALAKLLPSLEPGSFGHVASYEVDEVLGPTRLVVEDLWLIDGASLRRDLSDRARQLDHAGVSDAESVAEARATHRIDAAERQSDRAYAGPFLLIGTSTQGLARRQRVAATDRQPLKLAVVGREAYRKRPSSKKTYERLVLAPTELFRTTPSITEAGMVELLSRRGLSPAEFVALTRKTYVESPREAEALIFARLIDHTWPAPPVE